MWRFAESFTLPAVKARPGQAQIFSDQGVADNAVGASRGRFNRNVAARLESN